MNRKTEKKKEEKHSQLYVVAVAENMTLKSLKKRLEALKPKEQPKEIPKWCYEYVDSISPERWTKISDALSQFKQGKTVNTEALNDDREFYERIIEANKEGIIEL